MSQLPVEVGDIASAVRTESPSPGLGHSPAAFWLSRIIQSLCASVPSYVEGDHNDISQESKHETHETSNQMLFLKKKIYFYFICMGVYLHACLHNMCVQRPQKPKVDVESNVWMFRLKLGPL